MSQRPNIYSYLDYRAYLKDMYTFKKRECPGFSYRFFSRFAGLKSSNFLKLVMDGKRNLSNEGIQKFAHALKLTKPEINFFETLVLFCQAKSVDEKNRQYERIAQTKRYHEVKKLEASQYDYFSNWYYVALRELVKIRDFREDPQWINRKLGTKISHDEIQKAIKTLLHLKLLERDSYNRLRQTEESIVTSSDIGDLAVLNFHKEMIKKAGDALEQSATTCRDISALTVSVSREQFSQIKERINDFRREIHAMTSASHDPEAVCQINFQLFNLSEAPWNSKKN